MDLYQSLPAFCALGVINLSVSNGNSKLNQSTFPTSQEKVELAHFCASCQQGYKATPMSTTFSHIVVKCEKIQNCLSSRWFNYCSQCQNGYVYAVDSAGRINYDECVSTEVTNCFA